jgi:hypothetical protein
VYRPSTLLLTKVYMHTHPKALKDANLQVDVKIGKVRVYSTAKQPDCVKKTSLRYEIALTNGIPLCGDVKFEFYAKSTLSKDKLCHFWFNTCFVPSTMLSLSLTKEEIDKAHKDKNHKNFDREFRIDLIFSNPEGSASGTELKFLPIQDTWSRPSLSAVTSEDDDSFENDVGDEEETD